MSSMPTSMRCKSWQARGRKSGSPSFAIRILVLVTDPVKDFEQAGGDVQVGRFEIREAEV